MRVELAGRIGAAGFASGDRVVVGVWASGPLGPMTDVMWARPDGERVLLAPSERGCGLHHLGVPLRPESRSSTCVRSVDERALEVEAGLARPCGSSAGAAWRLPPARLRPPWFTRYVEGPIARCGDGSAHLRRDAPPVCTSGTAPIAGVRSSAVRQRSTASTSDRSARWIRRAASTSPNRRHVRRSPTCVRCSSSRERSEQLLRERRAEPRRGSGRPTNPGRRRAVGTPRATSTRVHAVLGVADGEAGPEHLAARQRAHDLTLPTAALIADLGEQLGGGRSRTRPRPPARGAGRWSAG